MAVLAVVLLSFVFAFLAHKTERSSHKHDLQEARAAIREEASLIAARLESEVNASFYLISGLASYIGLRGEISAEEYASICERMYPAIPGLVDIAAAPDLVNQYVYPLEGNEMILGMDYGELPEQIGAIKKLEETKRPIVAGPVELVQGGRAIIGRFPVFEKDESSSGERLWGIISTPILTEVLYEEADVPISDPRYEIAFRGKDGLGSAGEVFLGDGQLFQSDAVIYPVHFYGGFWELALAPKEGWPTHSSYRSFIYGVYGAICLLCILLFASLCLYLKRVEEAREVERSVQLVKERFYSNMSHEIRTPLNAILGLSDIIVETTNEQFTKESSKMISNSAHALSELISDVLFLSEDAINDDPPPRDYFDVNTLLQEVLAPLIPEVENKELELQTALLPEEQSTVCMSKQYLRQILWNLALNAVKFTPEGKLFLRLYLKDDKLGFECSDTGVGIDESYQSELYDEFTQEDTSMSRSFDGAGLGLAIVKRSVDLMKGEIRFESEKGVGTTFWVELPQQSPLEESPNDT